MQKILIVDDEEDIREILRFNLETEGYAVDGAASAAEALPLLSTGHDYCLILLDVMMAGMSGLEMAKLLRDNSDRTPIVFLTARDAHDDQIAGFDAGADDYITKPFAFDTVLARIRAVLRRSSPAEPPITADLTRREYLIFQLLRQNAGRYLSRAEILAAAWPDDTFVGERSVDVHIARLRKKLGAEGARIINKTGFGYGIV